MKPWRWSTWVMTAVCDVAGGIASRDAGSGSPMSPMPPPPKSRNSANCVPAW